MIGGMSVNRHFLPWDKPLLPQAVAHLAAGWNGAGPLDLSRLLVIVPTRQSGRRLREALAEHAAGRGQAALPPRIMTPDGLIAPAALPAVASRLLTDELGYDDPAGVLRALLDKRARQRRLKELEPLVFSGRTVDPGLHEEYKRLVVELKGTKR